MYRSSPFRSTLRTNVKWFRHENGFAWQAQCICNVCMNQPCTRSAKTLKKCRKTWGYNKFMVRKNGHKNAPLQVDGAKNKQWPQHHPNNSPWDHQFFLTTSRYVEFPNVLGPRLRDHAVVDPTSCATPRWYGASHLALSTSLGRVTLRSWMWFAYQTGISKPSTSRHGKKFYQNKIPEVKRDFGILLFQRVKKQNSPTILLNIFFMSNLVSRKRAGCFIYISYSTQYFQQPTFNHTASKAMVNRHCQITHLGSVSPTGSARG